MKPDVKPELQEMIQKISLRNMYYGNKIPSSLMAKFEIVEEEFNAGIKVPFWISILQYGRGVRKSNRSSGLIKIIYRWMEKRNMFTSKDAKGKMSEAWVVTRHINKFGTAHFQSKRFVDIYETARKETIEKINKKFGDEIYKITSEVL
jgi:hypothetical protein